MITITFYSYKGGVGRTLAMANVAKWLSEFKKRVCMIDFDLEAPGLHFKFEQQLKTVEFKRGIVDYIHDFVTTKKVPQSIKDCLYTFHTSSKNPPIQFIPAGNVSSPEYWKKLSAISWKDLFYKDDSEGVPFFLDLKEKIRTELSPEFLLIDSRTGISEISGITMSLYADKIVIIAANNKENLFGARDIIKNISNPDNNFLGTPPEIIFVLSRIPYPEYAAKRRQEESIIDEAKRIIDYKKETEILTIHTDRDLEVKESLKISFRKDKKTPIAQDYLRLFDKLTSGILTVAEIEKFNVIKEAESLAQQAEEKDSDNDKIELLTRAINLHSNNDDFFLKRGQAFYRRKQFADAVSDFNDGIKLNENNIDIYYIRSWSYYRQKKYDLAILDMEKIIRLDSKYLNAYYGLGVIAERLKDYDRSIQYNEEALKIDPYFYLAYNAIALACRYKKNYELAFKNIYKALEINPQFGYAYSTLAEIYSDIGNENEFYKNTELALIFETEVEDFLSDKTYEPYLTQERFKKLLQKYKGGDFGNTRVVSNRISRRRK